VPVGDGTRVSQLIAEDDRFRYRKQGLAERFYIEGENRTGGLVVPRSTIRFGEELTIALRRSCPDSKTRRGQLRGCCVRTAKVRGRGVHLIGVCKFNRVRRKPVGRFKCRQLQAKGPGNISGFLRDR
jgi:hypothetical protein